jgi:hypothetical protein
VITLLVVGAIAWVLTGAVEDTIRSARGDAPRTERRGFRGYLDDRWKALADHHHAVSSSGMLTAGDARLARKHLARTKALKLAGLATDEDVARAKAEHQHRLGFIAKGVDPDTMPPLFPVRGQVWEPPTETEPPAEPEPSLDDHYDTNADVLTDPALVPLISEGVVHRGPDGLWTEIDQAAATKPDPTPQEQPWDPFTTSNTDTKENHMPYTGEITGPASVLAFHNDLAAVMDATRTTADTLTGMAAELEQRAAEMGLNVASTETAAAGMGKIGMSDACNATLELMETQQHLQAAMAGLAATMKQRAAAILDNATASAGYLAHIKAAHDAQLSVQDARAAAGRGNLADDAYLDGND